MSFIKNALSIISRPNSAIYILHIILQTYNLSSLSVQSMGKNIVQSMMNRLCGGEFKNADDEENPKRRKLYALIVNR